MNFLSRKIFSKTPQFSTNWVHTSAVANKNWFRNNDDGAAKFLAHNKTVFPPEEGVDRPAVRISPFLSHSAGLDSCYQPPYIPVCLPCKDQHQIQSQEVVVCRQFSPGNDGGRGGETTELYTKEGS